MSLEGSDGGASGRAALSALVVIADRSETHMSLATGGDGVATVTPGVLDGHSARAAATFMPSGLVQAGLSPGGFDETGTGEVGHVRPR